MIIRRKDIVAPDESPSRQAAPSAKARDVEGDLRERRARLIGRRLIPQTTGGILAAIMISALIPFLLLQIAIYVFWLRTRTDTEMDANIEVARSVASAFETYLRDIRRQGFVIGNAIRAGESFSPESAGKLLTLLKNQYPTVTRFSLVDESGVVLASSDPLAIGISVADRSYIRDVRAGQEWTVSDLTSGPLRKREGFSIASKIETGDDRFAIIVAIIDPNTLGTLDLSLNRPSEGVFCLFDREGNLVFHSGDPPVDHPNWKASDPVLRKAMQGNEAAGIIVYPPTGTDHFVARVPIRSIGWTAGASRPVETAMGPIYRNAIWIAALNGAIVVLSLAGAFGLRRFLIGRLDQLREYARRIAGGDFSMKAGVANPVEFAELEISFNAMADQVKARQQSLQKAVRDLTRSNQELEQFAYVASHDLQEPLRVITGFVQLIEKKYKGRLDHDADRYIGFITDAVSRQQQLIRGLLFYSRLGRQTLKLAPTDANMAVENAIRNIHPMIHEAKASVTHDELPIVQADEAQLVQVFQNLIANGIKFRRSDPSVHISARAAGSKWTFAVRDNGIGIDQQYWDQIFVMFKRLHTRKDYPGTGIGLAICKKIIERHGGRIWLDSTPGEGTTVYFTLEAVGDHDEF